MSDVRRDSTTGDTSTRGGDSHVRAVSYGGGVQSTALLVLAAQGRIDFDLFLFANTGDDSEHPTSLRYVREIAAPYAEANNIELVELHRLPQKGRMKADCWFGGSAIPDAGDYVAEREARCASCSRIVPVIQMPESDDWVLDYHQAPETLHQRLMHPESRSVGIPVRLVSGAPGTRSCTVDFKIRVVAKELKRLGATKENPATVALGISTDEIQRAKPGFDEREPVQFRTYPLLDLGIDRRECKRIISAAGLPVPPKSSCYFCPYHSIEAWRDLKRNEPDLFAKSVELEATLRDRREALGKDDVFFTDRLVPLDQAIDDQLTLGGMGDDCDSGWCFT